jgi:hypothetical protein
MSPSFPRLVRTPEALRTARQALSLSADGLARMLRVEDGRSVRRWEAGESGIPGPVTVILETAMSYLNKRAMITRQLEMLRSGQMRTGCDDGRKMVDDTAASIAHLENAGAEYKAALEILLRQSQDDMPASEVHWYHLWRQTPLHSPPEKDDWSLPGEVSPEAALAYFEKHEGFGGGLLLCSDAADLSAEFILEKREVIRTPRGKSVGLRAGMVLETFSVRRRS